MDVLQDGGDPDIVLCPEAASWCWKQFEQWYWSRWTTKQTFHRLRKNNAKGATRLIRTNLKSCPGKQFGKE